MMERLKELLPLWTVLAFFAAGFGALGSISPEGTPFEDHAATLRMACYGAVLLCLLIGALALVLERLRRFSRYLGRGIRASVAFVRENILLVVSLMTVSLLLWWLYYFAQDPNLWPIIASLLVVACIAMTIGVIRLLAMIRPSFLGLPVRAEEIREAPSEPKGFWPYDFIDHFSEAEHGGGPGTVIEPHLPATCGHESKRAIFEHPPISANEFSLLTYNVMPPRGARPLKLEGFIGIETEQPSPRGTIICERSPGNPVLFEVSINGKSELRKQKHISEWEEFSIPVHRGESLSMCFVTNCVGNNEWNWAVWGEPRLTEAPPTSSAAG